MDALSPNTAALLSYLGDSSFTFEEPAAQKQQQMYTGAPQSLPPSAFFNMPITPELTPESSNPASESPEGLRGMTATDSEEEKVRPQATARKVSDNATVNKRKAGHAHTVQEEHDDDEDDSGSDGGHEDKRAHGNDKATGAAGAGSGRRGGRKSISGETGNKELSKAAKRKEQNRAAQKAFRDRREAKVKDLEDKINALESKSFGAAVENENLRGILKRLQEENVALKQAAFTFTMPVSGTATPTTQNNNGGSVPPPNVQRPRPPSPPSSDDNLRSIHDIPGLTSRKASLGGMVESPDSLVSATSSTKPSFGNADMFNAFAMGVRPEWARDLPANQAATAAAQNGGQQNRVSPTSVTSDSVDPFAGFASSSSSSVSPLAPLTPGGKSELDALWASFYPDGTGSILPQQTAQAAAPIPQTSFPPPQQANAFNTASSQSNAYSLNPWSVPIDKMAFRDQTTSIPSAQAQAPTGGDAWANLNEDNINDFLASLDGSNANETTDPMYDFEQADDFNSQLQKLLEESGGGASPSAAFNLSPNTFSPTAYLNLSPSPNASGSASSAQSPANLGLTRHASGSMSSLSNSASPESSGSSHPSSSVSAYQYPTGSVSVADCKPGEIVHVIGADGQRLKPSELWVLMGMQHNNKVDNLVIDDLCDQMKSKATCADGAYQIGFSDAETLFKHSRSRYNIPAAGAQQQ